jgi:hypothetical protein
MKRNLTSPYPTKDGSSSSSEQMDSSHLAPGHFFPNHHRHEPRSHHWEHVPGLKARGRQASVNIVGGRGIDESGSSEMCQGGDEAKGSEVKVGRKRQIIGILVRAPVLPSLLVVNDDLLFLVGTGLAARNHDPQSCNWLDAGYNQRSRIWYFHHFIRS